MSEQAQQQQSPTNYKGIVMLTPKKEEGNILYGFYFMANGEKTFYPLDIDPKITPLGYYLTEYDSDKGKVTLLERLVVNQKPKSNEDYLFVCNRFERDGHEIVSLETPYPIFSDGYYTLEVNKDKGEFAFSRISANEDSKETLIRFIVTKESDVKEAVEELINTIRDILNNKRHNKFTFEYDGTQENLVSFVQAQTLQYPLNVLVKYLSIRTSTTPKVIENNGEKSHVVAHTYSYYLQHLIPTFRASFWAALANLLRLAYLRAYEPLIYNKTPHTTIPLDVLLGTQVQNDEV